MLFHNAHKSCPQTFHCTVACPKNPEKILLGFPKKIKFLADTPYDILYYDK